MNCFWRFNGKATASRLTVLIAASSIVCAANASAKETAPPHVAGFVRFHPDKPEAQGGAILYSELGCANCHGESPQPFPRQGPELSGIQVRVRYGWVAKFLQAPGKVRPGTNMPHLLAGLSGSEIASLAAYLGSLGQAAKLKPARHVNAERGAALYHEKGCVACHSPSESFRSPREAQSANAPELVPFSNLTEKYSLTALDHFLSRTSAYRKDGRMPQILLDKQESIDVAAHLLDYQDSDPRRENSIRAWPKANREEIAAGKMLAEKYRCASCHQIPGLKTPDLVGLPKTSGKINLQGCLAESPSRGVPNYGLSAMQRDSLVAFLGPDSSFDTGELPLAALNCYACHDRNGVGGPTPLARHFFTGDESLGDSGRLPPPLTGVGFKLKSAWLKNVFEGKDTSSRVRPYLKAQMPAYPHQAEKLADWFSKTDAKPDAPSLVNNSADLEAGRKLLGIVGGVNCITCHHWGEKKSLGIPGPDLISLDQRMRPEWFREYLLNPPSYRPGTLMPPLWPGGKSVVPDVLGGDTERQIGAIWNYIVEGQGEPEGFPSHSSGEFELIPNDRPIIQRTFFEKTGSKAILAGFPGEIHIAYDGLKGAPSLVWRGKFFDAYHTWFTRAAPFEKPLGEEVYPFDPPDSPGRFRGYQLDPQGNPTFLVERGGRTITEKFEVKEKRLIRTLSWDSGTQPKVTHPQGVDRERNSNAKSTVFTYVWK